MATPPLCILRRMSEKYPHRTRLGARSLRKSPYKRMYVTSSPYSVIAYMKGFRVMGNSMVSCVTFFSIFRAKIEVWLTSNYVYISPNCIFVWEISIFWLYEALKGNCDQSYLNNALRKMVSCVTKMWHFWITPREL